MNHYLSAKQIAAALEVAPATVSKWRERYDKSTTPTPTPDVWIGDPADGGVPGWESVDVWQTWREGLPGQGVGGGPLPLKKAADRLAAAAGSAPAGADETSFGDDLMRIVLRLAAMDYDVDEETVKAIFARIEEETPELGKERAAERAYAEIMRNARRDVVEDGPA